MRVTRVTWKVLFYGYGYRWLRPRDNMTVGHYMERSGPIRRQLLGAATGRSCNDLSQCLFLEHFHCSVIPQFFPCRILMFPRDSLCYILHWHARWAGVYLTF
jgi:hypothetical protein